MAIDSYFWFDDDVDDKIKYTDILKIITNDMPSVKT